MVKLFYSPQQTETENIAKKAYLSTVLAAFFWGTSFVVVEFGLEIINPFWFAQFRFFMASLGSITVVYILRKRIEHKLLFSRWIWLLGLFNALGFLGQFLGQTMTNATKTALLINLNLVSVAILSIIIFNESFTKQKGIAVILAISGVFLLTTNGDLSQLTSGEFVGDMFAFCAGLAWAFYIVTNKKIVSRSETDVVTLTAAVMFATTIWLVPITITFGGINISEFHIGISGWGYVIYLGLLCNVLTYLLWTYGLRYLTATASTILLLVEVLVAAILAMILLNEYLTMIGIVGGTFILAAIVLINLNLKDRQKKMMQKHNKTKI